MTRSPRKMPSQATSYMTAPPAPPAEDDPLLAFTPVPHVAPRRNSITPGRQRAFIAHIGVSLEAPR